MQKRHDGWVLCNIDLQVPLLQSSVVRPPQTLAGYSTRHPPLGCSISGSLRPAASGANPGGNAWPPQQKLPVPLPTPPAWICAKRGRERGRKSDRPLSGGCRGEVQAESWRKGVQCVPDVAEGEPTLWVRLVHPQGPGCASPHELKIMLADNLLVPNPVPTTQPQATIVVRSAKRASRPRVAHCEERRQR